MNKKTFITPVVILVLAVLCLLLFYLIKNKPGQNSKTTATSYQMSGKVSEFNPDYITVSGNANSTSKKESQPRSIVFQITPQTIFKNKVTVFTKEELTSTKQFAPEVKLVDGKAADIIVGTKITNVTSKEDLFTNTKATAVEIDYATYQYPKDLGK